MTTLDTNGIQMLRNIEDQKTFNKKLNNTTTAHNLIILLDRITHKQTMDRQTDTNMIEILKQQKFNNAIPTNVPTKTNVAHKTNKFMISINSTTSIMNSLNYQST